MLGFEAQHELPFVIASDCVLCVLAVLAFWWEDDYRGQFMFWELLPLLFLPWLWHGWRPRIIPVRFSGQLEVLQQPCLGAPVLQPLFPTPAPFLGFYLFLRHCSIAHLLSVLWLYFSDVGYIAYRSGTLITAASLDIGLKFKSWQL